MIKEKIRKRTKFIVPESVLRERVHGNYVDGLKNKVFVGKRSSYNRIIVNETINEQQHTYSFYKDTCFPLNSVMCKARKKLLGDLDGI